jgi:hypothetical protein
VQAAIVHSERNGRPAGGSWSRIEADITVKAGKAGVLRIEGDATFGAKDPGRVRRRAVKLPDCLPISILARPRYN